MKHFIVAETLGPVYKNLIADLKSSVGGFEEIFL